MGKIQFHLTLPVGRGRGLGFPLPPPPLLPKKGFPSITLLNESKPAKFFSNPSLINKKSVESQKISSCPQNVGEGDKQS